MQSPLAYRELFGIPMFGVGMTGERLGRNVAESPDSVVEKAHA